ncbi:MAG TPA: hypothetical protein VJ835_12585 [Fimbriimonadaceae bacterium]|nr:hypothetical protein [Fimbriimonadaceae bacterium]
MNVRDFSNLSILELSPVKAKPSDRASVEIYRPFFLAGIFSVLTVGCLLGAIALFGIGQTGTYTSATWAPFILAHANSQLFGWVGFFIMGFALQQHAPTLAKVKLYHQLAWFSLIAMGLGIALRFVAEPMVATNRTTWLPVGVAACTLQLAAVAAFVFNTSFTRHRKGGELGWQTRFVFASLFWLIVVAAAEPFVFAYSHQTNKLDSIQFIARWYPVLREAQFLGFVAMMIFGVSLVKLNSCFGFRESYASLGKAAYSIWTVGLILRMFGWLFAFDQGFVAGSQILFFAGGACIAAAGMALVVTSRVFEATKGSQRSHKFVRGAYSWLIVAALMILWDPIQLRLLGAPFSHAYTGASRHAVTVGFISQMILGFGCHVTARMNDFVESKMAPLWSAFFLLNIGNAARVGLEIASDFTPAAFAPMGITGFVELVGLGIWAYYVAGPMLVPKLRLRYVE